MVILYINDLPDVLKHTQVALYADDTKLYSTVQSEDECNNIQKDIESLYAWSVKWGLDFNCKKCKILTVNKQRTTILVGYNINGNVLERVGKIKDLGVIQSNLSWNNHVDCTVKKAKRVLGLIRRTVGIHAPVNVKLQLYTVLVRSMLEY
eukprot:GHVU01155190.1.p1 GENE.GHVU01155190.1~~GHVU01155190.1.p1  ORF type:complete len:150 (-),score=9.30 GHVU01155190.1:480-929(-)